MELIEMAVLVAAKQHERKTQIAGHAQTLLKNCGVWTRNPTERELLLVIDRLVNTGDLRKEGLVKYSITEHGIGSLKGCRGVLDRMKNTIDFTVYA